MTVLTHSLLALSVKAIKIVVSSLFAITCLTYHCFDALERGNEDINIQHVLMWVECAHLGLL